jgi:phospholipid/cholesterol/gamma-HCH transport system ATP-binding protein
VAVLNEGKFLKIGGFDEVFSSDDAYIKAFYDYNFTENNITHEK